MWQKGGCPGLRGDMSFSGLRGWLCHGDQSRGDRHHVHAISPVRLKLSGMPLLRPHLLFGRYHMLEEGPDPSQEQSPPR